MRILLAVVVWLIATPSYAAQSYTPRTSTPAARSAPVSRPMIYRQPVQPRAMSVPSQRTPASDRRFYPSPRTIQPGEGGKFANPVRRAIAREVRLHGGALGLPALIILGVPVLLDVPDIGEVSVDEETYVTLYPLLTSDDVADRERAFVQLQQQVERSPESLIRATGQISAAPPVADTCPECPDMAEKFPICHPRGCDLAERLISDPQNPSRLILVRPTPSR